MEIELKYIILKYTEKDIEYIDLLKSEIEKRCQEIVDFFNIKDFGEKIEVKLFGTLEEFREFCEVKNKLCLDEKGKLPEWVCGVSFKGRIITLTLEEYRKTKSHEDKTIDDLILLILHEFTHSCHDKIIDRSKKLYKWLSEGLATTISHQYDKHELSFNATLDQIIHGKCNYINYHTMFKYVLDTYGRDYILELLKNHDLLVADTPKLYDEVNSKYNN